MRINASEYNCSGCTACATKCPRQAITMQADQYGFKYPVINDELCIDCGICVNTCQFHSQYSRIGNYYKEPKIYAARQKDERELHASQTGGLSALILKVFFDEQGVAYGVGYKDNFVVSHIRVTDYKASNVFRGSKYVQSNLDGVFQNIKADLTEGKRVLFIGCPCQVSGLKSCIPSSLQKKLTTIDLICHCNSAPGIWEEYLHYIKSTYGNSIIKVNFRDKKLGWKNCFETYELGNGKVVIRRTYDDLYFKHLTIRPSCTKCPYTNFHRVGDITLGDFWGWDKYHKEFNDNLGLNLVLVNSEKGFSIFNRMMPYLDFMKSSQEESQQPQLLRPISPNPQQLSFLNEFNTKGIRYVIYKYGDMNYKYRLKRFLYRLTKLHFRK